MKKINLKIFLIILITAICILFPKDVMAYDFYENEKTLQDIFIKMRKDLKSGSDEWLNSTPASSNEVQSGWGGEGYSITALQANNLLLDEEKGDYTPGGMIHAVGALCFGHATKSSGDSVKIRTINIDYNSSKSLLKLAYLVTKSSNPKAIDPETTLEREVHNSNKYKNMIRRWLWNNSSKYGIKVQSKNDANSSYDIDEVNNYAEKLDNRKFALKVYKSTATPKIHTTYKTDAKGNTIIDKQWTYIGPIKVKCDDAHPINGIYITGGAGQQVTMQYYTEFDDGIGGDRKPINELKTGGKYKKIYVVTETTGISQVLKVKIKQPVTYYKAKIVLSQPDGAGGQNLAIFYGKEVTKDLYKEKEVAPDDDDKYSIEIKKINNKGDTLPNIGFVIQSASTGQSIKNEATNTYVFKTDNRGIITIEDVDEGIYYAYEVENPYEEYREVGIQNINANDRIELKCSDSSGVGTFEETTPSGIEYTNEVEEDKSTVTVKNNIEYIDVSGNVWEDGEEGKESRMNNFYDGGNPIDPNKPKVVDKELEYVRVRLKER